MESRPVTWVWTTECEVPAHVLCIELESHTVKLGYNVAGIAVSQRLTAWLHSQDDLLELYRHALRLSRPGHGSHARIDVPSIFILIKLEDTLPEISMSPAGMKAPGELSDWIFSSRPELGELFMHAVRLAGDMPSGFDTNL